MRIDEFSKTPDGTISSTEQTRFLLFGFDLTPTTAIAFLEDIVFNSFLSTALKFNSPITKEMKSNSPITKEMKFNSLLEGT